MLVVTHSGKFHADDIVAWSLLCTFLPNKNALQLTRTRDPLIIEKADIVFDVGDIYDPKQKRFDHHQRSYTGFLSSAGMVLQWLHDEKYISQKLFETLHHNLVDDVDKVDNGLRTPDSPCFSTLIGWLNTGCNTFEEFDAAFLQGSAIAEKLIAHLVLGQQIQEQAEKTVLLEMTLAMEQNRNWLEFTEYLPWKSTYFQNDGQHHPTEFTIFPTMQGTWQVVCIPPEANSMEQKRSLPEEWAGLRDEELSKITEAQGIFCHKNRFIAVFTTKEDLFKAMRKFHLLT